MQRALILASFATVALALLAVKPATATPIYNNLNSPPNHGVALSADGGPGPLADSFSTGSAGYSLASVALNLYLYDAAEGYDITIDLLADNATSPDTLLTNIGTINDTALTESPANYVFNLATSYALAANTRYWIEVSAGSGTSAWMMSNDQTAPGVAGEYSYIGGTVSPTSDGAFQMELSDAPINLTNNVDEPGKPLVLVALGALGLLWLGRRRASA